MKSISSNENNASTQSNSIIKRHFNDQAATVEEILALSKKTTLQVDDPTKLCNILKRVGGGHSRFRASGH